VRAILAELLFSRNDRLRQEVYSLVSKDDTVLEDGVGLRLCWREAVKLSVKGGMRGLIFLAGGLDVSLQSFSLELLLTLETEYSITFQESIVPLLDDKRLAPSVISVMTFFSTQPRKLPRPLLTEIVGKVIQTYLPGNMNNIRKVLAASELLLAMHQAYPDLEVVGVYLDECRRTSPYPAVSQLLSGVVGVK
jgi:hypothetical protein